MKSLVVSCTVLLFFVWLLPLGVFIKPSQEKVVCDGQRAICMCHAFVPKASDKAMEPGINLKAGASSNKENSSAGNYFVSVKPAVILNLHLKSLFQNQFFPYKSPFLVLLEHVPKF
jgi:hypothetical protein